MSTQRLVQLARRPVQDVLPALWLCPALLSNSRCFTSTSTSQKSHNMPGRLKAKMRRERVREGEKLRRATKSLEHGRRPNSSAEVTQIVTDRVSKELEYFRALVQNTDVVEAFDVLERELGPRALDVRLTETFLRTVHHKIRTRGLDRQKGEEIVNGIRDWYTRRNLPGSPTSTRTLLGCYRDMGKHHEAVSFWDWARRQRSSTRSEEISARELRQLPPTEISPDYTDLSCYGMALPILARAGRSVQETEDIYIEAVRRYATGFNEYHLNHTAWQPNPEKPTTIPGASIGILTGLMASRFIQGRVVPGYLCLDTILKLHPTQVPISVLAELSKERPLSEQVQVLCMALRGGHVPSSAYIATVFQELGEFLLAAQSIDEKADIFEMTLTVLRLAHICRASLNSQHLNMFLTTTLLSAVQGEVDAASQLKFINNFFEFINIFGLMGVQVDGTTIRLTNKLIGHSGPRDVVNNKLDALWVAFQPLQGPLSEELFWETLTANASLGLSATIQDVWHSYFAGESLPSKEDCMRLARLLAESTNATELRDMSVEGPRTLSPQLHDQQHQQLSFLQAAIVGSRVLEGGDHDVVKEVFEEFKSQLQQQYHHLGDVPHPTSSTRIGNLLAKFKASLVENHIEDLQSEPVTRISVLPRTVVSDSWQRELYHELVHGEGETVEAVTTPDSPDESAEPSVTGSEQQPHSNHQAPTGISLADLRYQNWCDMNHVLLEAQAFDALFNQKVDEAFANGGMVLPFKSTYNVKRSSRRGYLEKQWDLYTQVREYVASTCEDEETWKITIKELRKGLEPAPDV